MKLFWSPPGEISTTGCWVLIEGPYLYTGLTLWRLFVEVVTGWRSDKHLVG